MNGHYYTGTRLSDPEFRDTLQKMLDEITRTPETARAYLVELGIATEDGKLTKEYGGEG